jgi:hypothetical protein
MARKPNFRFERQERERVQAEKRAARDALKAQRKAEQTDDAAGPAPAGESDATAATPAAKAPDAAPPPEVAAAVKALATMTPDQIAVLHQNAVRLAESGSPKQRVAARALLPQLEAELQRLDKTKREAVAARMAAGAKRGK